MSQENPTYRSDDASVQELLKRLQNSYGTASALEAEEVASDTALDEEVTEVPAPEAEKTAEDLAEEIAEESAEEIAEESAEELFFPIEALLDEEVPAESETDAFEELKALLNDVTEELDVLIDDVTEELEALSPEENEEPLMQEAEEEDFFEVDSLPEETSDLPLALDLEEAPEEAEELPLVLSVEDTEKAVPQTVILDEEDVPQEADILTEAEEETSDEPVSLTFDEVDAAMPTFRPNPAQQAQIDAFIAAQQAQAANQPPRSESEPTARSLDALDVDSFDSDRYEPVTFGDLVSQMPHEDGQDITPWDAPAAPSQAPTPKKPKKEKNVYEYLHDFQREGILTKYRNQCRKINLRLTVLAVLLVVGFFYDIAHGILPAFLDSVAHPVAYLLLGDALCLAALLCVWGSVYTGVRQLIEGKLQPQLFLVLAYLVTLIYQIVVLALGQTANMLHATWYLIALCLAVACQEKLEFHREVYAFATASEDGEKLCLQAENGICYARRADFFENFYHRNQAYPTQRKQILYYLCAAVAIPLFFLITTLAMGLSAASVLRCTYLAFILCLPASFFFFYTVPQYFLAKTHYDENTMVVNEKAACDLAKTRRIDLNDDTVINVSSSGLVDVKIYENFRIDRAMYYLASALSPLHCALAKSVCFGVRQMGHSAVSTVVDLQQDGICAIVDEKTRVEFGTGDYMRRKHYLVAQTAPMEQTANGEMLGLAFLAVDSNIVAQFKIRYVVNEEFLPRLHRCSTEEIDLVVRTVDPILSEALLRRCIPQGNRYRIFLQKMQSCPTPQEKDSGVAMTSAQNENVLIDLILQAKTVAKNTRMMHLVPILSMIVGLFVMAPLQNAIIDSAYHFSWIAVLYQLLTCGVGGLLIYLKQLKK